MALTATTISAATVMVDDTTSSSSSSGAAGAGADAGTTTPEDALIKTGIALMMLLCVAVSYHYLDSNGERRDAEGRIRGGTIRAHCIYAVIAVLVIVVFPLIVGTDTNVTHWVFSDISACFIATVFPIYASIRAVCTPEEEDDEDWLQYWIVGGVVFVLTEWVDDALGTTSTAALYWYMISSAFFLWLYFPITNGAAVLYDHITDPFFGPKIRTWQKNVNHWITLIYQTSVNVGYLYVVWVFFMFLPEGLKRIIAVAVGVVYPWISSVAAASTEEVEDDTYWLTYWSCYGCLFLIMDTLETWLGWVPFFYTVIILATVYLMLPMIQGADKVFRHVLVPLAGLQEMLILRDALIIKKRMMKSLDPTRQELMRKAILQYYQQDDAQSKSNSSASLGDVTDPLILKKEFKRSYRNFRLSLPTFLGGDEDNKKDGGVDPPNERTSFV